MISVKEGMIRWQREDVRLMAKILGSEFAVFPVKESHGQCPMLPSILKLAHTKGMILSDGAKIELQRAEDLRYEVGIWKAATDGKIQDRMATRYFPHQRADLALMYRFQPPGLLIASEAGVGKTLPAIRYAKHVNAKRIALIVPSAAKDQWRDEIHRWGGRRTKVRIVEGTIAQQMEAAQDRSVEWAITHPESLVHARNAWLVQQWDMIIADEAHLFGNRDAQRTQTLHKMKAEFRVAMTAHPYANATSELWSILRFLYPDAYTSFWRWAHLHIDIEEGAFGGLDLRTPRRPKLLQWEIAPFTIRHLWKEVWKNLPPVTRVQRTAYLTAAGEREYKELKKKFFARLEGLDGDVNIVAIPSILARVMRMRQYVIDPAILGGKQPSVKYPVVLDIMDEVNVPVVIFSMFREATMRLKRYLKAKGKRVAVIVGGMARKVNRIKKKFLRGKYDAVIIMIKVGGTSLNFGKYGKLIYLDHPWNQRDVEQTEGRVRRPEEGTGKLVPCTSYHIVVHSSYEETMQHHRDTKHENFSKVFTVAQARELFEDNI